MKLEITSDLGTIRLSDNRMSLGRDASLADVLGEMVDALKSVAADHEISLSQGEFGFQVSRDEEDEDPETSPEDS